MKGDLKTGNSLKILIISQYFPPDPGGNSTRVLNAIKGLERRKHEITAVVAFPHYPDGIIPPKYGGKALSIEAMGKHRIIRVWMPRLAHSKLFKRLILYVTFIASSLMALPFTKKADIIWAVSPNFFVFFSGIIFKMFKRARLTLDVGDLWPDAVVELEILKPNSLAVKLAAKLARIAYRIADVIIATSPNLRKGIIRYGVEPGKVHVVEEGVDTEIFHPVEDVESVKARFKLKGKFIAMYSGNIGPAYDFDTILVAAKILSLHPDIYFIIKGRGECLNDVLRKLRELKLNNILISTELLDFKEISSFINMADVFLLPMKNVYILPTKIYEYMACGKPVICCAKGETADLVRSLNVGLVVEPGNPEALAQAILTLYKNRDLLKKLGESGYSYVSKFLSIEKIGSRLERIFSSIV